MMMGMGGDLCMYVCIPYIPTVCIPCRRVYFRAWDSLNSTSVEGSQPPGFSTDTARMEMKVKSSFQLYNNIVDIRYWFGHLV